MDDARALLASDAGEVVAAMMQQRIDERIVVMAWAQDEPAVRRVC